MLIKYCGPYDEVYVPAAGIASAVPGEPVDVADDVAASLLEQDCWEPAEAPAPAPAAPAVEAPAAPKGARA